MDSMPLIESVYFDHTTKKLCVDKKLLDYRIDPTAKLEVITSQVACEREQRLGELEESGKYTKRLIDQLVANKKQMELSEEDNDVLLSQPQSWSKFK